MGGGGSLPPACPPQGAIGLDCTPIAACGSGQSVLPSNLEARRPAPGGCKENLSSVMCLGPSLFMLLFKGVCFREQAEESHTRA